MYADEPTSVARVISSTISLMADDSLRNRIKVAFTNAFGEEEWPTAALLINGESGFDPYVVNQSSFACGLFQALPCSKVGGQIYFDETLKRYRLDPKTVDLDKHIEFGVNYIKNSYINPSNAYYQWQMRSPHWY